MFIKELAFIIRTSPVASGPRGKVAHNAPFPTGRQNALNLLKNVKLTQNVRTKSNIIKTSNRSFSVSRNKTVQKNKLETVQWKKPRK